MVYLPFLSNLIAIIGTISKIFDSLMTSHLTEICIMSIGKEQHGFVEGKSSLTRGCPGG